MQNPLVSDFIAEFTVAGMGLKHLFGVSGANIEDLVMSFEKRSDCDLILAKSEKGAATMCDGYYRSSGKAAILFTTSGGGALNTLPALAEAYTSNIPMLVLIGNPPLALEGNGAFQDTSGRSGTLSLERVLQEVSSHTIKVKSPEEIISALLLAERTLMKEKKPFIIILPKDIQKSTLKEISYLLKESDQNLAFSPKDNFPDYDFKSLWTLQFQTKLKEINPSNELLLILGPEIYSTNSQAEVHDLISKFNPNILVSPEAKSLSFTSSQNLGVTGVMGNFNDQAIIEKLSKIKLVLIIGCKLSMMESYGLTNVLSHLENSDYFSINEGFSYYSKIPKNNLLQTTHFKTILKTISALFNSIDLKREEIEIDFLFEEPSRKEPISIHNLGNLLNSILSEINKPFSFSIDAGNCVCSIIKDFKLKESDNLMIALGMGGMGFSFAAAIGAFFANRKRGVVIAGDGSFYIDGLEIHTAIEYNLPICFIIVNNEGHGMCVTRDKLYLNKDSPFNRFKGQSYIAKGLQALFPSLDTLTIECNSQMGDIKEKLINLSSPLVIEIKTNIDEIPPFLPFEDEMMKIEKIKQSTYLKTLDPINR